MISLVLASLALAPPVAPDRKPAALPPGAVLRLGSRAFRSAGPVNDLTWSPDGAEIASSANDHTARIFDATTGEPLIDPIVHPEVALMVRFDPAGLLLYSCDRSGTFIATDVRSGKSVSTAALPDSMALVAPDGKTIAGFGRAPNEIDLLDADRKIAKTLKPALDFITDAAFFADGTRIAVVGFVRSKAHSREGVDVVLDLASGESKLDVHTPESWAQCVAVAPDGAKLATGGVDGTASLFDVATGARIQQSKAHEGTIGAIAYSPDGQTIATGAADRKIAVFDGKTGQLEHAFVAAAGAVEALAFSPDGKKLAAGGQDATVRVFDPETGTALSAPVGHVTTINALAVSPDGARVATGAFDGRVIVWSLETAAPVRIIEASPGSVFATAFSPAGDLLAAATQDGGVVLDDMKSAESTRLTADTGLAAQSLAFSPDGKSLVVGFADQGARIFDLATRAIARKLRVPKGTLLSVAWSPDGTRVALGASDVFVFDAESGVLRRTCEEQKCPALAMRFFADGRLAVACGDAKIRIYELEKGKCVATLSGHTGRVQGLAISPDQQTIASTSMNETCVRLFDVASAAEIGRLEGHDQTPLATAFLPDGRVVSAGMDASALVWRAPRSK